MPRLFGCALIAICVAFSASCKDEGPPVAVPEGAAKARQEVRKGPAQPPKATAIVLTAAVQEGRLAALSTLLAPNVLEGTKTAELERVRKSILAMGALKDSEVIEQRAEFSRHRLEFEKGTVELGLTYDAQGRVAGFLYSGDALDAERAELLSEAYGDWRVYQFVWLRDEKAPNPNGNRFALGEQANFGIVLGGLGAAKGQHHVVIDLEIFTESAQLTYRENQFLDHDFPVNPEGIPRASLYAQVQPPARGRYRLQFVIRDIPGGRTLEHEEWLVVQ